MNSNDGPFVAQDGLEYASKVDRLLGRPIESYRNWKIQEIRNTRPPGVAEGFVREWIEFHDRPAQDSDWADVESFGG